MRNIIDEAPEDIRSILMYELEKTPELEIYDLCHRVEPHLNRQTYHKILRWADRYSEKMGKRHPLRN